MFNKESNETSHSCKCCNKLKEEIIDLKNALAKFTLGKNNLDIIRGKKDVFLSWLDWGIIMKINKNCIKISLPPLKRLVLRS